MIKVQGISSKSGVAIVSGISSTNKLIQSYPLSTMDVYLTGTTTHAPLFTDAAGTVTKPNPFTVNSDASFGFYIAAGRYDLRFSGTGITAPFTLSDIVVGPGLSLLGLNVSLYAATGNGTSAHPWTGWDTATPWAANTPFYAPAGYYNYSSPLNLALTNIQLLGDGPWRTIFQYGGSGIALNLGGITNVLGVRFENFSIHGNASATKGIFADFVDHGIFRNIEIRNVSGIAFDNHRTVANVYDNIRVSSNEGAFTTQPTNGLVFGASVHDAADTNNDCVIINPIIEGVSGTGIAFFNCQSMTRIGGTSEGNFGNGTVIDQYCLETTLIGVEDESNTLDDIVDGGTHTHILKANCNGTVHLSATSQYATIDGGLIDEIKIESGAVYPTIRGYPIVNTSGTGGVTGAGATGSVNMETPVVNASSPFNLITAYTAVSNYQNSWVDFGGSQPALYRRVQQRVVFRGAVKAGTNNTIGFTMPAGFRPGITIFIPVRTDGGLGWVTIAPNGDVRINVGTGANTEVDLDSISYDAAG